MLSETYTGIGTDGDGSGRGTLSRVRDTPICRHTDQLYMSFAADLYETELTTKVARRPQPKAFEGTETESRLINMALICQLCRGKRAKTAHAGAEMAKAIYVIVRI
jgi:hypothetical protein